jgi:hypothetical protein
MCHLSGNVSCQLQEARSLIPERNSSSMSPPSRAFCRERLAGYKVPARFMFRKSDEFARTPTGNVQKPRLRDELA